MNGLITQGAVPVHCYIRPPAGGWSQTPCTITYSNTTGSATVTFDDVPAGHTVWVTIHLDFKLKGQVDTSMTPKSYSFTTSWKFDGVPAGSDSSTLIGFPKKTTLIYGFVRGAAGQPIAGATPNGSYNLVITAPAGYSLSSSSCQTSGTASVSVNQQGKAYRKDWTLYATCP